MAGLPSLGVFGPALGMISWWCLQEFRPPLGCDDHSSMKPLQVAGGPLSPLHPCDMLEKDVLLHCDTILNLISAVDLSHLHTSSG